MMAHWRLHPWRRTVAALATVIAVSAASARAAPVDEVRALVSDPAGSAAPGCAVGVFRAGQTVLTTAAGMADLETGAPLGPDTPFYAASVSKQFTALAAATLVVQGKLRMDDDIRTYLPELPRYSRPITIAMLLHHTSGVRDSLALISLAGIGSAGDVDKDTALRLLFAQKDTNFTPGTAYNYSNGGYLLLAEIVARVSHTPFPQYVRQTILAPLGMTRSGILDGAVPLPVAPAHGYLRTANGFEVRDTYPRFGGSGGLVVTINDFAKYDRDIQLTHTIWTPEIARLMETPGTFTDGRTVVESDSGDALAYASGLMVGQYKGQSLIEHDGGAEGFVTRYLRLPQRKLGIVLLCNRTDWRLQDRSDAIIDIVEDGLLTRAGFPTRTPELRGAYASAELKSTYTLKPAAGALEATRKTAFAPGQSTTVVFTLKGDKSYVDKMGDHLRPDADGQGFTISDGRVAGIHFAKVQE